MVAQILLETRDKVRRKSCSIANDEPAKAVFIGLSFLLFTNLTNH